MISGLTYIPEFITREEESSLIQSIELSPWNTDISRRRQQYGLEYNVRNLGINKISIPPIPEWLNTLTNKLVSGHLISSIEQCIVNEYEPGQGISPHIDSPIFGDTVISLSLLSGINMRFSCKAESTNLYLERRSLVVLFGEARNNWTHEILRSKSDTVENKIIKRSRRVSITFRNLKNGLE